MNEYWQVRGNSGAAWVYHYPANLDGTPHPLASFLRLILKDSGALMVEGRRSRSDKWTRFAYGHASHRSVDTFPSIAAMRSEATAAGLLP